MEINIFIMFLSRKFKNKKMEPEEELILGRFKIGDVVVSLTNRPNLRCEGDLFVVLPNSGKYALYYLPETNNGQSKEWRLATKEEKEAYERGIKNIKDMAPTIFKKGQYIVTLIDDGFCGTINYCSKQKNDSYQLEPEIDTNGNKSNKNGVFRAKDVSFTKWRWATKEEEEEYERRGKPFDVTELSKPKFIVGKWYKFNCYASIYIVKVEEIKKAQIFSTSWILNDFQHTRGGWPISSITNIEEVDVSIPEIQNTLEDGHPDKINSEFKCVPGEIYRVDWGYKNSKYFLIFKSETSDYKTGKVQACNAERFFNQIGVCSSDDIKLDIKEATLEEKQWLDRCIQENKWVPIKQEGLIKGEIYKAPNIAGSIFMYDSGTTATYCIGQHLTTFIKNDSSFTTDVKRYTLANEEDKKWLLACIKADRFIEKEQALKEEKEKEYRYHTVYTKTIEEWNFVLKYYNSRLTPSTFTSYPNICYAFKEKNKKTDCFGSLEYLKTDCKIYSFEEWKKEMNINSINITTSGTLNIEQDPIHTSKYIVKLDEFGRMGFAPSPYIKWKEYKYSNKGVHNKKQEVEHQEPIIKKKINNKKSILVL